MKKLLEIKLSCNKKNKDKNKPVEEDKKIEINLMISKIKKPDKLWEKWEIKEWEWINKYPKLTTNKLGPLASTEK